VKGGETVQNEDLIKRAAENVFGKLRLDQLDLTVRQTIVDAIVAAIAEYDKRNG